MNAIGHDSLNTRRTLTVEGKDYSYYSLIAVGVSSPRPPGFEQRGSSATRWRSGETRP